MIRLIPFGVVAASALLAPGAFSQDPAPRPSPPSLEARTPASWSDAEKEAFLLEAEVKRYRDAPGGVTNSRRATLLWKGVEHDAHIQVIDEQRAQKALTGGLDLDFRDSWRNNVAAYRLDRLLGLHMIPVTVSRVDNYKAGSFTWWIDDVLMTEKDRYLKKIRTPDAEAWNRQIFVVRVFDQLIYNTDRNLGNLVIDKGWSIWMIDHTRAFKIFKDLKTPKDLAAQCERDLFTSLKKLDKPTLEPVMKNLLSESQIDGLLARRDKIVKRYETQLAARGEASVLYDLPPRQ